MLTQGERRALLRVTDQLSAELGLAGASGLPPEDPGLGEQAGSAGIIGPADERLVIDMRRALARVAEALEAAGASHDSDEAVDAALDGAEMVMRGEIVVGNIARLPILLPGFVFLVALPLVDQERALEISNRCATLVEQIRG